MKKNFKIYASRIAVAALLLIAIPIQAMAAAGDLNINSVQMVEETTDSFEAENPEYEAPLQAFQSNAMSLPADIMTYHSLDIESRQIASTARNGVYFLNGCSLLFYSLETLQAEEAYQFPVCEDSYVAGNKLYILGKNDGKTQEIQVYNLDEKQLYQTLNLQVNASAVGADETGRIYLAGSQDDVWYIYLFSAGGNLLSTARAFDMVYDFGGFDSKTGNFYYEHYYNWPYWGYDHDMHALGVGSVNGDTLQVCTDKVVTLISQNYYYERQRALDLIGNKYLCIDNTFHSELEIWSSSRMDAVNPSDTQLFYLDRDNTDTEGEFDHYCSVGTRTVYHQGRDSIITFSDNGTLAEYMPESGTLIGKYSTAHPVFSLLNYGEDILAVEKDGEQFYLEIFSCKAASYLKISGGSDFMYPVSSMQFVVESDSGFTEKYTWSSSDSKVASVTQNGKVFAWRKGRAVIQVQNGNGLSANREIVVDGESPVGNTEKVTQDLEGEKTSNASLNDYETYGTIIGSYLVESADGALVRVEYSSGHVITETYDISSGTLLNSKVLEKELDIFGGFFNGRDAYYIVYGQENEAEQNNREVLRVVEYAKDWSRMRSVSIYGANTYSPFDAGSLRMAETDGKLYIHTCHTMYKDEDGIRHQANMTYVIDERAMDVNQSYYDILNIAQAGYVSHSFNQFIQTDGEYVYRVDHGDGGPRAVSLTRCNVGGKVTDVKYTLPLPISGSEGDNATGVSVGGFELSEEACIIAGNSVPQGDSFAGTSGQRNIFVTITSKDLLHTDTVWVTSYGENDNVTVRTPHLTKIGEGQFLLMWEEQYGSETGRSVTKMATMDSSGNLTSDIASCRECLSDCSPVFCSDKLVRWYTADGEELCLYTINPFDLSQLPVSKKEQSMSVEPTKLVLMMGEKAKTLKVLHAEGSLTWKSSHPEVAKVTQNGRILPGTAGKTTIMVKAAGNGEYKAKTVKVQVKVIPRKPGQVKKIKAVPANAKHTAKITWSKISASGYQIQYADNKKMKACRTIKVAGGKKISKTIKKLNSRKYVYVRMRAYNTKNGFISYGKWSKVVRSRKKIK